jgi:hypothetical protein
MPRYERPVTPAEISTTLRQLIDSLVQSGVVEYVDVRPLPDVAVDDCVILVDRCVSESGGSAVLGWALWEFPTLFVEAEFHTVWRQPSGTLLDISPKKAATDRVLFLPDPSVKYEGMQINNVRVNFRNDPDLDAYLRTFDDQFELMNRGARAGQHGLIKLTGEEVDELASIHIRRDNIFRPIRERLPKIGAYDPCPCGSGKKVKWCHKKFALE